MTSISFPGIYFLINPKKQKVFLGEALEDAWLEMNNHIDLLADNKLVGSELQSDYKDIVNEIRCDVFYSNVYYYDEEEVRKEALEKAINYIKTKHPTYQLYDDESTIAHRFYEYEEDYIEAPPQIPPKILPIPPEFQ